jgi:hypothetical protein
MSVACKGVRLVVDVLVGMWIPRTLINRDRLGSAYMSGPTAGGWREEWATEVGRREMASSRWLRHNDKAQGEVELGG